jgi:hypothetical protein
VKEMARNSGELNPDGTVRYAANTESLKMDQPKRAAFTMNGSTEVKGDNADRQMLQFEECKYSKEAC